VDTADKKRKGQPAAWRRGWFVFLFLAALTAAEFIISITLAGPLPYLTAIALAKAVLIIIYFMHAGDLRVVLRREVAE